ncbi:uncharacterized protein CcaverHIS019_0108480 [Cutaneotrichosporon cavernicola]|uniref:Thioesterase domain-containing protein n=1 Tax=Cutaneotrichosporon cavernicola TaxID=279322 RepID=A0AA48L0E9_9TREE|nr:uncharacterized protein CcaverHIS019_0108480 [Cutaneotrichosporon cavernicola]BEI88130.1 hypothetical protein CcaverHIS019_0108480 [Cutaneotrichosporon cavernicola]BEI95900.1 hypothetical protein CcaverHIS631_0108490 [Cutaneotrichosporon cavernicola]BEJ03675.1 hypothetical protein CcaverHIS641_0108500 [Cutaneotrichosporon cavernicola]
MPDMVPFDGEAATMALGFLHRVPFAPSLHHAPKPEVMDPIPPINKRGGRTVGPEGWRSVYSVVVTEDMCNPLGNLHGGAAATLIDTVSSASSAILATEGFWGIPMLSGVSIALDVTYYNACPVGTKAKLTVTIEHMGGSLGNLRADLTDWETGKRYASGTHVKTWRDLRSKL